ncbi:MAG: macro domain-containing protein [Planctomycetes bacterium]|nr:macro domain-containing protein [Planctomycetota bacterium]
MLEFKYQISNQCVILIKKGDITSESTDAIVNAANSRLIGGGGVDGAIRSKAGRTIELECEKIRKTIGECKTGNAVITSGGNLSAKFVIHAVGPVWKGGNQNEPELLRKAYRHSLEIAIKKQINSISFPSISTGIYGYPVELASEEAINEVVCFLQQFNKPKLVKFVLFDDKTFANYQSSLSKRCAVATLK